MQQQIYRLVFWIGYFSILIITFVPAVGDLNKIKTGQVVLYFRLDLLLHFLVYFLICMYYLIGLNKGFKLLVRNSLRKFILVILLLGVITEIIQLWVPERAFNVFDLVSNVSGVGIGVIAIKMVQKHKNLTVLFFY